MWWDGECQMCGMMSNGRWERGSEERAFPVQSRWPGMQNKTLSRGGRSERLYEYSKNSAVLAMVDT